MFTQPAQVIAKQLERISGMKLTTSVDDKLQICTVCLCPLKVKVHTPVEYIKRHTTPEVASELAAVPGCWVTKELNS